MCMGVRMRFSGVVLDDVFPRNVEPATTALEQLYRRRFGQGFAGKTHRDYRYFNGGRTIETSDSQGNGRGSSSRLWAGWPFAVASLSRPPRQRQDRRGTMAARRALITGITGMVGSHLAEFLLEQDRLGRHRPPAAGAARSTTCANIAHRINSEGSRARCCTATCATPCRSRRWWPTRSRTTSSILPPRASHAPASIAARHHGHQRPGHGARARRPDAARRPRQSSTSAPRPRCLAGCRRRSCRSTRSAPSTRPRPTPSRRSGTDLVGRFYAEAYGMTVMTTRMFTHTGPRRGDVFAESTFAKQIAMIEHNRIPPVVKVGNLQSLRTVADVRDAVRAYYMLVTVNPTCGRLLQYRRHPLLHRQGHPRHADLVLAGEGRHQGRGRSRPAAPHRCRPAGAQYREVPRPYRLEARDPL